VTCYRSPAGLFTLCTAGPTYVASREPVGIKWCFNCRKHLPHDWVVIDYTGQSYYDPYGRYDCSGCHEEHVLFPGRVWEWE
jgi:hypothetical protein